MEFKDGNKEYSIEFEEIHNRHNGVVQAQFVLNVYKPFEATTRFTEGDIKTLRGVKGVNFYKSSKIATVVGAKQDVLFSLVDEALSFIEIEAEKGKDVIKTKASKKTVENWVWAIGGDTHNLYISTDNLDSLEMQFRDDLKEIRDYIGRNDVRVMKFLREHSHNVDRDTALYTVSGWYEISNEDIMAIYAALKAKDIEKKFTLDEKRRAIFDKASTTGERQILRRWLDECCDPNKDCSIDNIIEYAMPDGAVKTERHHNW